MALTQLEQNLRDSLEREVDLLQKLRSEIEALGSLPRDGTEITETVLLRMRSYYLGKNHIKKLLNKALLSAGSDFFVETVVFYLQLYCSFFSNQLAICSEIPIRRRKNAIRPDISIWKNEELTAIIECKTQLGWSRNKWEPHFLERERILKQDFPSASAYLLVMTKANWPGFREGDQRIGKQLFTLSSIWPGVIEIDKVKEAVLNPIEALFNEVISHAA